MRISLPPPLNFRRTRYQRHASYAVTHLAIVADRIDRPYSPCCGREGRELEVLSKNMRPGRTGNCLRSETPAAADYCSQERLSV